MSILVTRSSMPPLDEYVDEIKELWDSHWLTNMGIKHKKLQKELQNYLNVEHMELVVNGHMALELALQALNLRGEVITTPFTFVSTTHAIVRNNLKPVFCDIDPNTYTIDTNKLETLITDKTCAILPVHVYGNICDVEELQRIAQKYDLKLIYDAAHTFGETYKGRSVIDYGDVATMSFHATKVFNTIEGGAVCCHDHRLADKLYDLKNFGIRGEECVESVGANAKMNEFSAAMGLCNLRHLDEEIEKRKMLHERYMERLDNVPGIQLRKINKDLKLNYAYFPVVFHEKTFGSSRNEVMSELAKHDIKARKYFYPLTNSLECFHDVFNVLDTPIAQHIAKRVLTLPLYADLSIEMVDHICNIILSMKK